MAKRIPTSTLLAIKVGINDFFNEKFATNSWDEIVSFVQQYPELETTLNDNESYREISLLEDEEVKVSSAKEIIFLMGLTIELEIILPNLISIRSDQTNEEYEEILNHFNPKNVPLILWKIEDESKEGSIKKILEKNVHLNAQQKVDKLFPMILKIGAENEIRNYPKEELSEIINEFEKLDKNTISEECPYLHLSHKILKQMNAENQKQEGIQDTQEATIDQDETYKSLEFKSEAKKNQEKILEDIKVIFEDNKESTGSKTEQADAQNIQKEMVNDDQQDENLEIEAEPNQQINSIDLSKKDSEFADQTTQNPNLEVQEEQVLEDNDKNTDLKTAQVDTNQKINQSENHEKLEVYKAPEKTEKYFKENKSIKKPTPKEEKKEISFRNNLELKEENLELKDQSILSLSQAIKDINFFIVNKDKTRVSKLLRTNNTVENLLIKQNLVEKDGKISYKLVAGKLCTSSYTPEIENSLVKARLNELLSALKVLLIRKLEAQKIHVKNEVLTFHRKETPSSSIKEKSEIQPEQTGLRSNDDKNHHKSSKSEFAAPGSPVPQMRKRYRRHARSNNTYEKKDIKFELSELAIDRKDSEKQKKLTDAKIYIQEFCRNIDLIDTDREFLLSRLIENPNVKAMLKSPYFVIDNQGKISPRSVFKPRGINTIDQGLRNDAIEAIAEPLKALAEKISDHQKDHKAQKDKQESQKDSFKEKNNPSEIIRFEEAEEDQELIPKSMPFSKQDFVKKPDRQEISDERLLELYDATLAFEDFLLNKEWKSDSSYSDLLFEKFLHDNTSIKTALEKKQRWIPSNQQASIVNSDNTINYEEIYPGYDSKKDYPDINRLAVRRILDQLIYWLPNTINASYNDQISKIAAKYPNRSTTYSRRNRTIEKPEYQIADNNNATQQKTRQTQIDHDSAKKEQQKSNTVIRSENHTQKEETENVEKLLPRSIVFSKNDFRRDKKHSPEISDHEFLRLYENTLRFTCSLSGKEWKKENSTYKDYFFKKFINDNSNKAIKIALKRPDREISSWSGALIDTDETIHYENLYANWTNKKDHPDVDTQAVFLILDQLIEWLPYQISKEYDDQIKEIESRYFRIKYDPQRREIVRDDSRPFDSDPVTNRRGRLDQIQQQEKEKPIENAKAAALQAKTKPAKKSKRPKRPAARGIILKKEDFENPDKKLTDGQFRDLYKASKKFLNELTNPETGSDRTYKERFFDDFLKDHPEIQQALERDNGLHKSLINVQNKTIDCDQVYLNYDAEQHSQLEGLEDEAILNLLERLIFWLPHRVNPEFINQDDIETPNISRLDLKEAKASRREKREKSKVTDNEDKNNEFTLSQKIELKQSDNEFIIKDQDVESNETAKKDTDPYLEEESIFETPLPTKNNDEFEKKQPIVMWGNQSLSNFLDPKQLIYQPAYPAETLHLNDELKQLFIGLNKTQEFSVPHHLRVIEVRNFTGLELNQPIISLSESGFPLFNIDEPENSLKNNGNLIGKSDKFNTSTDKQKNQNFAINREGVAGVALITLMIQNQVVQAIMPQMLALHIMSLQQNSPELEKAVEINSQTNESTISPDADSISKNNESSDSIQASQPAKKRKIEETSEINSTNQAENENSPLSDAKNSSEPEINSDNRRKSKAPFSSDVNNPFMFGAFPQTRKNQQKQEFQEENPHTRGTNSRNKSTFHQKRRTRQKTGTERKRYGNGYGDIHIEVNVYLEELLAQFKDIVSEFKETKADNPSNKEDLAEAKRKLNEAEQTFQKEADNLRKAADEDLKQKINSLQDQVYNLKENMQNNPSIKELEKTIEGLQAKLDNQRPNHSSYKDDHSTHDENHHNDYSRVTNNYYGQIPESRQEASGSGAINSEAELKDEKSDENRPEIKTSTASDQPEQKINEKDLHHIYKVFHDCAYIYNTSYGKPDEKTVAIVKNENGFKAVYGNKTITVVENKNADGSVVSRTTNSSGFTQFAGAKGNAMTVLYEWMLGSKLDWENTSKQTFVLDKPKLSQAEIKELITEAIDRKFFTGLKGFENVDGFEKFKEKLMVTPAQPRASVANNRSSLFRSENNSTTSQTQSNHYIPGNGS